MDARLARETTSRARAIHLHRVVGTASLYGVTTIIALLMMLPTVFHSRNRDVRAKGIDTTKSSTGIIGIIGTYAARPGARPFGTPQCPIRRTMLVLGGRLEQGGDHFRPLRRGGSSSGMLNRSPDRAGVRVCSLFSLIQDGRWSAKPEKRS